ncbi:hypothetical protein SRABI102_02309 [Stenotrophomonas lactitubi]|nr:hypothetical protein SRABI81_00897 [Stenotrophomonas lactitubi]CAH0208273.1 hypothetical protein SRABI122_02097 [Stenotrophomonas lactitubi]CAH0219442.1 hypothetical protein SRABI66_02391 [Stenotrophomonas lactitubi]CAH0222525.1 hypothetical protein SRABI102_02309 [Stenotrophomonas lactitubi]
MKVLRASPASFLVAASALHFFMRSCGVVGDRFLVTFSRSTPCVDGPFFAVFTMP